MSTFPPEDIRSFLLSCAGEWLVLRSRFAPETAPGAAAQDTEGNAWHSSDRGELLVTYLPPEAEDEPGGLAIIPPAASGEASGRHELVFSASGRFSGGGPAGAGGRREGTWLLRSDGSLELTVVAEKAVVQERIWFTKPNLRLRSSVEHRHDGLPGQASFSSEIRRVRPPAG